MDVLSEIIAAKLLRLLALKNEVSLEQIRRLALDTSSKSHAFLNVLRADGINIIAEFKRRSPSKGVIRAGANPTDIVQDYAAGGAIALSVLTEEDYFAGSLEDLRAAKAAVKLPVLRKDFVFEEYQVYESAAAGADALLLIVAALEDAALASLLRLTEGELGMDALVEVHTAEELGRALKAGTRIVGVNNRDLRTFEVSLETSVALAGLAPAGTLLVSESGLRGAGDVDRLRACGFRGFLVGETLMRADDPETALRYLLGAGGWGEAAPAV